MFWKAPESCDDRLEAAILMDRPPGGGNDLATNQALAALETRMNDRFVALEARLSEKIDDLRANLELQLESAINRAFTSQLRWMIGTTTALMAVVVAAVKI